MTESKIHQTNSMQKLLVIYFYLKFTYDFDKKKSCIHCILKFFSGIKNT